MSGGVDSTATALLLKQQHRVTGFFMELAQPSLTADRQRVQKIAKRLDIPLHFVDLKDAFTAEVLRPFADSYKHGQTPNPCIICNQTIKFGRFLDHILDQGMDAMATGHYAGIRQQNDQFQLCRGRDEYKDQSYFLARLNQNQLSRIRFPLSEMTKEDAYQLVEQAGFTDFRGRESQDICFLDHGSAGDYLNRELGLAEQLGEIVDSRGHILGKHRGIFHYTIGQRRGLGLPDQTPWYVTRLDAEQNRVVVGKQDELLQSRITVGELLWDGMPPASADQKYEVKLRHCRQGGQATIMLNRPDRAIINFIEPQRAVTPGQFAVIYDGERVAGSGVIQ